MVWFAHPARASLLEGFLILPLWLAARSSGEASSSCLSRFIGFMKTVALDAIRFRSYASYLLAQMPTTILSETRGL